jgi:hypothetical protein
MSQQTDPHEIILEGRASYPVLFTPKQSKNAAGQPEGNPAYGVVLLMDKVKDSVSIALATKTALFVKKEKWQDKPVNLTGKSIRDGSEKEATDGYGPGIMFLSARHTPKNGSKPMVVDRQLTPLAPESGLPYAGCRVRIKVRCWAQDNTFGKRINWDLKTVQFIGHDKPFGENQTPEAKLAGMTALPEDETPVDATSAGASQI